jgi:hypothetical protein
MFNKHKFLQAATISRKRQFQPWSNGTMQGVRYKMPSKRHLENTYTIYLGIEICNEIDQIKRLFKHAKANKVITHCNVYVHH